MLLEVAIDHVPTYVRIKNQYRCQRVNDNGKRVYTYAK